MLKSITLEVSLKPFKKTDKEYIKKVCHDLLMQWRPLLVGREEISVMLWASDGSEILDYNKDLSQEFEWAYFMGTANMPLATEQDEDDCITMHKKARTYTENPVKMTYGILKNIVKTFKQEGKKMFPNAKILIGETFDIGPEFAKSDFKYVRHREICPGGHIQGFGFVDSTLTLNADARSYATYPNGIPQGTPFATFFARQTKAFFKDMGFDYLWLSNGLGFSSNPWDSTGKIFDGENFHADKIDGTAKKVFEFWQLFTKECPEIPLHTRGTNNTAGIDYASDGVPLYDIYKGGFNILPPPNSPWAAINGNYGLELVGHMSRNCLLPSKEFLFRYYLHDPWWLNSPWYDRYNGYPTDIYLPMAISRITEKGKVQTAEKFNILSVDNSYGNMPDQCVYEPLPHILKAEKDAPDSIPFAVWLYPLKEYTTARGEDMLSEQYYGDKFIVDAVNKGLPLSCVVATDIFENLNLSIFDERIIVAPATLKEKVLDKLNKFAVNGGKILFYGSDRALKNLSINGKNVVRCDVSSNAEDMRKLFSDFGYKVEYTYNYTPEKLPIINISPCNNGMFFNAFNPDTTVTTKLKFPIGAPIFIGGETELENGYSIHHFSRCEHRECRIFIQQESGRISCFERTGLSTKFRRRFAVDGLKNATVYYFPESYCNEYLPCATGEDNFIQPVYDKEWEPYYHPVFGKGFKGTNKNGMISFIMVNKKFMK